MAKNSSGDSLRNSRGARNRNGNSRRDETDGTPPEIDSRSLARALQQTFTENEYRVLQEQLTGAINAVQALRDRAPDIAKRVWGRWATHAAPNQLSAQSRALVQDIVTELLHQERRTDTLDLFARVMKGGKPTQRIVSAQHFRRRRLRRKA